MTLNEYNDNVNDSSPPLVLDPAEDVEVGNPKKDDASTSATTNATAAPEVSSSANPEMQTPRMSKLLGVARPEWPMLGFALILMIGAESTQLVIPLIIAQAYNALVNPLLQNPMQQISHSMAVALIVYAAGLVAGFARAAILGVIGERMVARLRYQLYAAILKQDIAFFDQHKSGELVSRLGSDTTLLQQVISQSVPEALVGVIKTIVAIGLMFWISPELAGVSIVSVFVIFCIALPLGQVLGRLSKQYQTVLGDAQTYSTEAFGSMRTVHAFAAQAKELRRFGMRIGNPEDYKWWYPTKDPDHPTQTSTYRVGFFRALTQAVFYIFIFGAGFGFLYISLWYGFYLVHQGEMTLGDLTAFQSYIFTIGFGLGGAATHFARIFEGLGASGRVFYLLDRIPAIPKPAAATDDDKPVKPPLVPKSMTGNIELQDVSFAYASRPDIKVLHEFSLKIPANTTTALVGSSGAGKSTVVSLLQRFYDIDSGSILVDGHDLQELDLQWFRRHVGYVQQEPQLFGLSVRENLLYGVDREDEITQDEIDQACRDANAYDFITSWPNGFDTLVGERGVKLSGGQKQRVAIARALLTNCRILLLDEATSALDAESEHLVQQAIDKAVQGRTVIIIAHRLSTIQRADQIVVMSDHKIVDVGPHDQLLRQCGKYRDLIKRQSMITQNVSLRDDAGASQEMIKEE